MCGESVHFGFASAELPTYTMPDFALVSRLYDTGWLNELLTTPASAELADVICFYQAHHGLTVDGHAGPVTERHLYQPRFCGLADRAPARGRVCRWAQPEITWAVTGQLRGFTASGLVDVFHWAWSQWARVCGIVPTYTTNRRTANVLMGSGPIDQAGDTLAWSELPCGANGTTQLEQRYDTFEPFVFSSNPGPSQIDLGAVACHEIGHALGLDHLSRGNLLAPIYDPAVRTPQPGDIAEVVARYGRPVEPPEAPDAPEPKEPPAAGDEVRAIVPGVVIVGDDQHAGDWHCHFVVRGT